MNILYSSLKLSCEAYHRFVLDMLSDMYEFPKAYELPVLELEHFLDGRKLNGISLRFLCERTESSKHVWIIL